MLSLSLAGGSSPLCNILVLGAHADDIEIGCGGTLLRLLGELGPASVTWAVLGATGSRAKEAVSSAEEFLDGVPDKRVVVYGHRDSFFPWRGEAVKESFEELKQLVNPDLILTHRREDLHQDHRLVAELTWNTFRNHLILEYEIPKYEGDLGAPNVFVPLDPETAARKVDLIMKGFPSQHARAWFEPDTFWSLLRLRGLESNSPSRYAEGFTARKLMFG